MKTFYIVGVVLGTILPYWQLAGWIREHGVDLHAFTTEIAGNRLSAMAWLDVLVSVVVLLAFIAVEGRRLRMRRLWLPVAATFAVGVSAALPLFLLMRDGVLEQSR
jgi:hypothetical protein